MDIIEPMTKTKRGNQFILSIHDELTKTLIYAKFDEGINVLQLDGSGIFHEKIKQAYLYFDEIYMYIKADISHHL